MKTGIKSKTFQDVEGVKENLTAELNSVSFQVFTDYFKNRFKSLNARI
jgi:hypothetical protein